MPRQEQISRHHTTHRESDEQARAEAAQITDEQITGWRQHHGSIDREADHALGEIDAVLLEHLGDAAMAAA